MHLVGLEPTSLAALEPESSVCANFTTGAQREDSISNNPILAQGGIIKNFQIANGNPSCHKIFIKPQNTVAEDSSPPQNIDAEQIDSLAASMRLTKSRSRNSS